MATDFVFDIVLMKGAPWGFTMAGGKEFGSSLRIAEVVPGGQADEEQVMVGDDILEVNGSDTMKFTQADAEKEMALAGQTLMLTLARDAATGDRPRVQYEEKPRREFKQPAGDLEVDSDKVPLPGLVGGSAKLSKSPSPARDADGIIQGKTFQLLKMATENPDSQSWPSRLSGGGSGTATAGSGGHLRKAVIQMKPIGTEQTTILMSSPTEAPPKVEVKAKGPPARRKSEVEIICKSPTSKGVGSFTVSTKTVSSSPTASSTPTTTATVSVKTTSVSISQPERACSFSPSKVASTGEVKTTPTRSLAKSSSLERGSNSPASLGHGRSKNTSISEERSPWLAKQGKEESPSPQPDPLDDDNDDDDDDVDASIRQSHTFRMLARATKTSQKASKKN